MPSAITLPRDLARVPNVHFKSFNSCSFARFCQHHSSFKDSVVFKNNVLIFVRQGSKIMHSADVEFEIKSNEALFLKQGRYTLSNITLDSGVYEAYLLFFDNAFLLSLLQKYSKDLEALNLPKSHSKVPKGIKSSDKTLLLILAQFKDYLAENARIFSPLISLKCEEIFLHLYMQNAEFKAFLADILDNINLKFASLFNECEAEFLSVNDMAKFAKSDISSFSKAFKQNFKLNPKQYLDEKRFEKAKWLLSQGEQNINEICSSCGFSSPSWFIKRFKLRYGQTPKQFRNKEKHL